MALGDDSPPRNWISPVLQCGLGNRLFQFAAAAGAAEQLGRPLVFYMPACLRADHGPIATLFRMFPSVPIVTEFAGAASSVEPLNIREAAAAIYTFCPFAEALASAPATHGRPVLVHGFRQSPRYFPAGPGALSPAWDAALGGALIRHSLEAELGLDTDAGRRSAVALHVRLGDYKHLPHHLIGLKNYYAAAVERLAPGQRIILFSDEPAVAGRLLGPLHSEVVAAPARSDVESLYQMSRCLGGTITANSTFSWWGAWFAHAAGAAWATFPDKWHQRAVAADLFPSWGTVIAVE
jgi:hypothetical protein